MPLSKYTNSKDNLADLPSSYSKWRSSALGQNTDALEQRLILDLTGDVARLNVLDIGCGDGEFAIKLCKRGATVVGIDASLEMIAAAKRKAQEHNAEITFEVAYAQSLPFQSDSFDLVIALTVLCFVRDPALVLSEMARVLRPGGKVVIGELGRWNSWAAARRVRGWLGSKMWHDAKFWTLSELHTLAREAGLTVTASHGAIYYPKCAMAAKLLSRYDSRMSQLSTFGAAFLGLSAIKPTD